MSCSRSVTEPAGHDRCGQFWRGTRPKPADALADRATTLKFLLRDRDFRFTRAFDEVFAADGIRILPSPSRAPRANAICERIIGTLRRELFDKILIVHERPYGRS
jgi:transposase InsO family protein